MSNENLTGGPPGNVPQLRTAEYAATGGPDRCKTCSQPIGVEYYRINGAISCPHCAEEVRQRLPKDDTQAYARSLAFGIGGAILGLILYATFSIVTGLIIGFVSLAVGYLVGKAMMKGSNGVGGTRYQVTAVILTYAAVSLSAVPIAISQAVKHGKAQTAAHSASVAQNAPSADRLEMEPTPKAKRSFGEALGYLVLLGLASPFLELQDPGHGFIGLIILLVGLRIAWQTARGSPHVGVIGPFRNRTASSGS